MKKFKLAFLLLFFSFTYSFGQSENYEQLDPKESLRIFFEGIQQADSNKVKSQLSENCIFRTIVPSKDGNYKIREEVISEFLKSIANPPKGMVFEEKLTSFTVKTDMPMVMAWTPYSFYVNGKFSHCGVNLFTFLKEKDSLKIVSIIDTRRKENCVSE